MIQLINSRYSIVKVLAEGGFGKTYLTEDTHLPSRPRRVIKLLKPITENPHIYKMVQDRFQREAAILEDLGNSNNRIPSLYAYFCEQGQFYLVQEYIEGKTLTQMVLESGPLGESFVKEILVNLLYVLNFVHSRQIIHRDIKPDNIIVRVADTKPVLIDFGAVRESMGTIVNSQGNPTSSIVIGTPGFMPPEQAAGRPIYSSDLYSLGLTMIFLLTGKIPQELPTDSRTGEVVWRPDAPNVSPSLAMILDKAIAYSPRDRFMSAKEMIDALKQPMGVEPTQYAPPIPQTNNSQPHPAKINVPPILEPEEEVPSTILDVRVKSAQKFYNYQQQNYQPGTVPNYQATWVGGGGIFNTSVHVPQEIQGWNWGAFLLPGLWPFTNNVWIGLLSWIPYVNLPIVLMLGLKGNTWAWRSRKWQSLEAFKAHQRAWAKAAIITYSSLFGLFLLLAFIGANLPEDENNKTSPQSSRNLPTSTPSPSVSPSFAVPTTRRVEIGNFFTYTYKTGLFSLDIPNDWNLKDHSKAKEVILEWQDRTGNAGVIVDVFANNSQRTQAELTNFLQKFLKQSFASYRNFSMGEPIQQSDGSVSISWINKIQLQGKPVTLIGNTYIEQRGDKTSVFTYALPEEQSDMLTQTMQQIKNSFKVNYSVEI